MIELSRRHWLSMLTALAASGAIGKTVFARTNFFASFDSDDSYTVSFPSMGSIIDIRWIAETNTDPEDVVKAMRDTADGWVDVLSDYQEESQCMLLCRQADGLDWVQPTEAIWRMLDECDRWNRLSEGAFDASLGAVTRLRRSRRETSQEQWQQARERCGWHLLEFDRDNHRVRFQKEGIRLDFGAIGKGFVVDRLGEQLRSIGIHRFVINAAGNMLCGDPIVESTLDDQNPIPRWHQDAGWPVAIGLLNDPNRELRRLRLSECGIATSGDQFQKYRDDVRTPADKKTSHIIDPIDKRGLERACMASIIAGSASDADAMATACCIHMQRGTIASWLARRENDLPIAECILQSQDDLHAPIRLTSVDCDW
jgi:thiamine biosynthesis lipoprotein